jgi:hypothetical protein
MLEVVASCEIPARHIPEGTEEDHRNVSQYNLSPGRDVTTEPPPTISTGGHDCPQMFSGHLANTVMKLRVPRKGQFLSSYKKRILVCRERP